MALDPDDPRPPYQQVANVLRAAILTRKFQPGEKLPSLRELADRYGVAKMTVQQALRLLKEDGLIVSRQGSGVFVRERTERPIGLRPHLEAAFGRKDVTVDFSGYTAETLHGVIQEPLDKIREGRLRPETIRIRILMSDMTRPIGLPSRADTEEDDPRVRVRMAAIAQRHTVAIIENLRELQEFGLVQEATAEARVHSSAPLFKLYIINGDEMFFGFYDVQQHLVPVEGEEERILINDPMGKTAKLFHHSVDPDNTTIESLYVAEAQKLFDSVWNTVARPYRP